MLKIVYGDITKQEVDAIVNAANRELVGGGGVDGAIWEAAGHDDMMRACNEIGGCEVGQAVVTPAFALPAKWVIHTVGPVWVGGATMRQEHEWRWGLVDDLRNCYVNSLIAAQELGAESIAFPAISTGVFRFPAHLAAETAVWAVRSHAALVREVRLVAYTQGQHDIYRNALGVQGS